MSSIIVTVDIKYMVIHCSIFVQYDKTATCVPVGSQVAVGIMSYLTLQYSANSFRVSILLVTLAALCVPLAQAVLYSSLIVAFTFAA